MGRLTGGLTSLAKQRKVTVVNGTGAFVSPHHIRVSGDAGEQVIAFEQCVIAAGSEAVKIPGWPEDSRIVDSTGALELEILPERMLVVGGGIIGLEMATVYSALGVEVSVVELLDQLIPGCDKDLLRPFVKRITKRYGNIWTGTKVAGMTATEAGIEVAFEGGKAPATDTFGLVLVAVGRAPNGGRIDADQAGVAVGERGFIDVDQQMRTNVPHIFAIGDIVGQPMLAHQAVHEAKVAAEVIAGEPAAFDNVVPAVIYTDPEVAWVGLGEEEAKEQGYDVVTGTFPFKASGRAMSLDATDGFVKAVADAGTKQLLGVVAVGRGVSEFIGEATLALEMGAFLEDVALTIHPHPTMSEAFQEAVEAAQGQAVHMVNKKN